MIIMVRTLEASVNGADAAVKSVHKTRMNTIPVIDADCPPTRPESKLEAVRRVAEELRGTGIERPTPKACVERLAAEGVVVSDCYASGALRKVGYPPIRQHHKQRKERRKASKVKAETPTEAKTEAKAKVSTPAPKPREFEEVVTPEMGLVLLSDLCAAKFLVDECGGIEHAFNALKVLKILRR